MPDFVDGEMTFDAGVMANRANSERDLATGVTRWMISNFGAPLADAVRSTPFSAPLLCAIACREAGAYWLPLTPHKPPAEVLGLCVYDASGDVPGAPRSAFPVNTAEFRMAYGQQFTDLLIAETNKARAARGLSPAAMVYKGYGIFQYDLQFVRSDRAFFESKQWYSFAECVSRAVRELKRGYDATHDIQQAVRAYNGSGPRAEQYARDVMRLLPYCEDAAAAPPPVAAAPVPDASFSARTMRSDAAPAGGVDDDPARPLEGELSETADLATARVLANLGRGPAAEEAPAFSDARRLGPAAAAAAAPPLLPLDMTRARAFLQACMTSHPRVTYGLGAKVPFFGAVPGKDFTKVDCSGFIRELVRLSTTPTTPFPDGSVVQHDWVIAHHFEKSSPQAAMQNDGIIRMAFLSPHDSADGIGHVLLVAAGMTLESHGGVGPDSRAWTNTGFQSKTSVYVVARP
jgi:hypothetical protein